MTSYKDRLNKLRGIDANVQPIQSEETTMTTPTTQDLMQQMEAIKEMIKLNELKEYAEKQAEEAKKEAKKEATPDPVVLVAQEPVPNNVTQLTRKDTLGYAGVFINKNPNHNQEVPFRVAIRLEKDEQWTDRDGRTIEWQNIGYFKSPRTAARAYNMMAICIKKQNAILNDYGVPTAEEEAEWEAFLTAQDNRTTRMNEANQIYIKAINEGHTFAKVDPTSKKIVGIPGIF